LHYGDDPTADQKVQELDVAQGKNPTKRLTALAFAAAVFGFAAPMAHAAPHRPAQPTVIKLSDYLGGQLSFEAVARGRTERFLFDTGGGVTVITPQFAERVGCKPWGQITGYRMRGQRLDFPRCENVSVTAVDATLTSPTAGVVDFAALLPKDAPPLAGSVALDAFAGKTVTLDVGHKLLTVETPASARVRIRGAKEVAVRFDRDVGGLALSPVVAVDTPQGRVWMEVDCGSDGSLILNRTLATALGMDPAKKGGQDATLNLAGGVTIKTRGKVEDLILDGNLGVEALKHWIITIDVAHTRMWMKPSGV
jgi:predicted aspartyl protease